MSALQDSKSGGLHRTGEGANARRARAAVCAQSRVGYAVPGTLLPGIGTNPAGVLDLVQRVEQGRWRVGNPE